MSAFSEAAGDMPLLLARLREHEASMATLPSKLSICEGAYDCSSQNILCF